MLYVRDSKSYVRDTKAYVLDRVTKLYVRGNKSHVQNAKYEAKTIKVSYTTSNWSNRCLKFIHICTIALEKATPIEKTTKFTYVTYITK